MATIAKPTNVTNNQVTIVSAKLITFHYEIMPNIVKFLPQISISILVHTCRYFRLLIPAFAMSLCKEQLEVVYPGFCHLLKVEKNSPVFHLARQNVEGFLNSTPRILGSPFTKYSAHANITDVISSSMSIRQTSLTLPGPQLLAFLDHHGQVMNTKYKQMVTLGGKGEKVWFDWLVTYAIEPFLTSRLRVQATL
ncbi:uncharacterized protein RCO7_02689 [Rhynchosporium graminicola]|uniref:Uncharacterized protein n=1 Tax=Rhynchosporium graminicola TaxID=2792576 RepID=A0A1E1KFW9_9HELO|nr:uncharacterized protein RCO7_02689 [Rhynchosporium commune]